MGVTMKKCMKNNIKDWLILFLIYFAILHADTIVDKLLGMIVDGPMAYYHVIYLIMFARAFMEFINSFEGCKFSIDKLNYLIVLVFGLILLYVLDILDVKVCRVINKVIGIHYFVSLVGAFIITALLFKWEYDDVRFKL